MSEFDPSFYSTAGQVIPVYAVTTIGPVLVLHRRLSGRQLAAATCAALAYAILAVFAEISALSSLKGSSYPSSPEQTILDIALFSPPGLLISAVVVANWKHIAANVPAVRWDWIAGALLVITVSMVPTGLIFGNEVVSELMAWGVLVIFFALMIGAFRILRDE